MHGTPLPSSLARNEISFSIASSFLSSFLLSYQLLEGSLDCLALVSGNLRQRTLLLLLSTSELRQSPVHLASNRATSRDTLKLAVRKKNTDRVPLFLLPQREPSQTCSAERDGTGSGQHRCQQSSAWHRRGYGRRKASGWQWRPDGQ